MTDSYDRDLNPIESFSTDATKWAGKRVLKSVAHGFKLSTVWLSLDHQYGNGAPIVFETLIWDASGEEVGGTRHYSEEEAARWHLKALDAIRAGAVPDYVNDEWMSAAPTSPDLLDGGVTAALIEQERAGSYTRTDEEDTDTRTREHLLAEEERAPAYWRGVVREYKGALEKAEKGRDEARKKVAEYVSLLAAPLARHLTADEMVRRGHAALVAQTGRPQSVAAVEVVLTAALTAPPPRHEGAEEIEEKVATAAREAGVLLDVYDVRKFADSLAAQHVGLTGAES